MTKTRKEKMDRIMEAFNSLDDDAFEKWIEGQPEEYGVLFYELMFPDTGNKKKVLPKRN